MRHSIADCGLRIADWKTDVSGTRREAVANVRSANRVIRLSLNPQSAIRNPRLSISNFLSWEKGKNFAQLMAFRDGRGVFRQIGRAPWKTQLPLEFFRGAGNDRPEKNPQSPANFGQRVKYIIQPGGLGRVLGQLERAGLVNVLVGPGDQAPDAEERFLQKMAAITGHHQIG